MLLSVLSTVISVAVTVTEALAVVGLAIEGIKAVGNALISLGKSLGLIPEDEQVEDLGDKAIQAEEQGIKPEKFDNYEEYLKEVEQFEVDPEKSKLTTEKEKIEKGIELVSAVTAEKFSHLPMGEFLTSVVKNWEYFNPGRMSEIGKIIVKDEKTGLDIMNYVSGKEKDELKLENAMDALFKVEKKLDANISDLDAEKNVIAARKN